MTKGRKKGLIAALICILGIGIVVLVLCQNRSGDAGKEKKQVKDVSGAMKDGEIIDYEAKGMIDLGTYKGRKVTVTPTETEVYQSILLDAEDAKVKGENADRVEKGDWISLDYEGFIDEQPVNELNESGAVIQVGAGDLFTPAFERGLMGLKIGSAYTVNVSFAEDYYDVDVAGQDVTFSVTVNSKFNDLYAKEMSKGKYKTVKAYYEYAKGREERENRKNVGDTVWEDLVKDCKVKHYPEGAQKQAYRDQKRSYKYFAEASGMTYEELISSFGYDDSDINSLANDAVRDRMAAKAIAKKENLAMTDIQYEQFLLEFLQPDEEEPKTLKAMETRYRKEQSSYPRDDMLIELVKQYLGEHAKVK